jgi:hypothetical protein
MKPSALAGKKRKMEELIHNTKGGRSPGSFAMDGLALCWNMLEYIGMNPVI